MRSNPYVYPSKGFHNPRNKKIVDPFLKSDKIVTLRDIQKYLRHVPQPRVSVYGKEISDRILSFFLDDAVCFGPKKYILDVRADWKKRFHYFISHQRPLAFTILGFPFKIPVPLKTHRFLPDMGELLALQRLFFITQQIKSIYPPGAFITIFTEGVFGDFAGVPSRDYLAYDLFLRCLNKSLGFPQALRFKKLSDMERNEDFKLCFSRNLKEAKRLYQKKDKGFMTKYRAVLEPVFRIVKSCEYAEDQLLDVYNHSFKDSQLSSRALKIRKNLQQNAHKAILLYFAYLKTKDDIHFPKKVVPDYLPLTVSPKPHRLGIFPISSSTKILPYHGVPVYNVQNKKWDIRYLTDIRRDKKYSYRRVFLHEDRDSEPFFYEQI